MSTETEERVEMSAEELERKLSFSHYGASAAAFEEVAKSLVSTAGNLFAAGKDDLARYLRDTLAPRFSERGKASRETQREYAE